MVFKPPRWVPSLDLESIPDSIPISHFMLDEKYGRSKLSDSKSPFICGLSGAQNTALEVRQRVEFLARGLAKDLSWSPSKGSEWDKVVTIFALNTKGVIVSHMNVIANVLQLATFEAYQRKPGQHYVVLGLLPQSHIYGLVAVCHASVYRGDAVVVLPKFDLSVLASAIAKFKINVLFIVPPVVISIINSQEKLANFDFSSVTEVFSGAAPLGAETYQTLREQYPSWQIRQAYGMTETATVISATSTHDVFPGSAGSLVPGVEARIVSLAGGTDITECGKAGELLLRSPSVTNLGYLNNEKATRETFGSEGDGWLRTGDEAMFIQNPEGEGHEHLFIVDRIKELIKVKGHQVAPAELEACLLSHPLIADVAVIPVPDAIAGEVPKAFIVLAPHDRGQYFQTQSELAEEIEEYVREEKARHKWLKGGIEFVDAIPKSPSGKILRRMLRDAERLRRREEMARL
ncbi:MAG: hypothetical protein Q9227_008948 [Pyrenula ochraceoflavens]